MKCLLLLYWLLSYLCSSYGIEVVRSAAGDRVSCKGSTVDCALIKGEQFDESTCVCYESSFLPTLACSSDTDVNGCDFTIDGSYEYAVNSNKTNKVLGRVDVSRDICTSMRISEIQVQNRNMEWQSWDNGLLFDVELDGSCLLKWEPTTYDVKGFVGKMIKVRFSHDAVEGQAMGCFLIKIIGKMAWEDEFISKQICGTLPPVKNTTLPPTTTSKSTTKKSTLVVIKPTEPTTTTLAPATGSSTAATLVGIIVGLAGLLLIVVVGVVWRVCCITTKSQPPPQQKDYDLGENYTPTLNNGPTTRRETNHDYEEIREFQNPSYLTAVKFDTTNNGDYTLPYNTLSRGLTDHPPETHPDYDSKVNNSDADYDKNRLSQKDLPGNKKKASDVPDLELSRNNSLYGMGESVDKDDYQELESSPVDYSSLNKNELSPPNNGTSQYSPIMPHKTPQYEYLDPTKSDIKNVGKK